MTYQEPRMIQEARPKVKIYLLAAIIAVTLVAAVLTLYYRTLNRAVTAPPETRLENALRAGDQEFEQDRKLILVERLNATQSTRALGDVVMELMATVKNTTGRTLNGLELRGAVLDAQGAPVGERTMIVIPARQATLKPGENLNVRVVLEGIKPDAERSNILMEVTGIRFE